MEQKTPVKPAARVKSGKPAASKPAVRKASVPARKTAARKPAAKKATSARSGSDKVVSMKDWVARYAAMNTPDAVGKSKARK
jgi:hypothetical protein